MNRESWTISLLCAVHVGILALTLTHVPIWDATWPGLWFGLFAGEASLLALRVTLGGGHIAVRILAALTANAALAYAGCYPSVGLREFWLWFGSYAITGVTTALPFVVLRSCGSHLAGPAAAETCLRPEALQFSIRDLVLWTLTAAMALVGFRWLASLAPLPALSESTLWSVFIVGVMFAAMAVVAAWAALGVRLAPLRIGAWCIVTALAGLAFDVFKNLHYGATEGIVISSSVVLVSLLVVRSAGYRFVRAKV